MLVVSGPASAGPVAVLFRFQDHRIDEASGIAVGHTSPGIVYVHNDSGDSARVFAIDRASGRTAAVVGVRGAENVDWEDMAAAPSPDGVPSLWLADIGDNTSVRSEIRIYRVAEPRIAPSDRNRVVRTARAEEWRLRYPDGPVDAESLAVTPGGTAYLVTKSLFGASRVYRVPARPDRSRVQVLERVGSIVFRPNSLGTPIAQVEALTATSAALSSDGSILVVRTYPDAYLWRVTGNDVATALTHTPVRVRLPDERQGEGVTVDGDRLLLDTEGKGQPVLSVPLPPVPAAGPPRSASSPRAGAPGAPTASAVVTHGVSQVASPSSSASLLRRTGPIAGAGVVILLAVVGGGLIIARRRHRPNRG